MYCVCVENGDCVIAAEIRSTEMSAIIGERTPRVDGPLKVSGRARYTSDFPFDELLYAVPVGATIANGRLISLDTSVAEQLRGVVAIFHRANIGAIRRSVQSETGGICEERRPPFEDDVIRYYGQYIAVAVADTFEHAKAAADAVRATYESETPNVATHLEADDDPNDIVTTFGVRQRLQSERGDADEAFANAPVKVDQTYVTPTEAHNPLEPHATTAMWDDSGLTLYDSTQGVINLRTILAEMFELPKEKVRVISKFLGSGFGNKLFPWPHTAIAAAASRQLGKPVKLVLSRKMMFLNVGHRPRTQQRVRVGATPEGKLLSLQHDYIYQRSILDDHHEDCGETTPFQYSVPNLRVTFGRAKRNIGPSADFRGPGAVPGLYAIESAMNELADEIGVDPVQLRIINEPEIDEGKGIPFSSRHLVECLKTGAEKFGWDHRTPAVGSMKRGDLFVGWGMAGCSWIAGRFNAEAKIELRDDGTACVSSATQDIGTGMYTVLAQLTAEKLGLPLNKIEVKLGDTLLPEGPLSGGSLATSSVVPAVFGAADNVIESLLELATTTAGSPFERRKTSDLKFQEGRVSDGTSVAVAFSDVLQLAKRQSIVGNGKGDATFGVAEKLAMHSFGCHFVEVTWQPETARLRVTRVLSVIDAGRIVNPLAGRNQIEGAVVMGIGMALFEHTSYDPQNGAPINSSLADYVMTVNADAPPIEVHFIEHPDLAINEIGARGIGEIGLAGIAAAITAAVHHATGVRVRELPVKIEDLLGVSP
jgi:xanthine dehydrogenase YagR molybdenum-binding subunit